MNNTVRINFNHISAPQQIRDVTKDTTSQMAWDQLYFVGFRIAASNGEDRYHHALICADTLENFREGIAAEHRQLLDYPWITSDPDITVVFVMNLMAYRASQMVTTQSREGGHNRVRPSHRGRNRSVFCVVGLTEQGKSCSLEVDSDDALKAIDEANAQVFYGYKQKFKAFLIIQRHPVAMDFFAFLDMTVKTLTSGMCESTSNHRYLH